jgi:hypothetical protein
LRRTGFRALDTDWKNVYVRRPNQDERETGAEPLAQGGRMCADISNDLRTGTFPTSLDRTPVLI